MKPSPDLVEHSHLPLNAEPPIARLGRSFLTPQADFYIRNHGTTQQIDANSYRLSVGGMVATPLDLSLNELRSRFAEQKVTAVMQCAGNRRSDMIDLAYVEGDLWAPGAISNAEWTGVSLADVLRAAGIEARSGLHVAFSAYDEIVMKDERFRYGVSIPLAKAMTPGVLLAYAMNGEPLMPEHGFPLRVVVPGYAGARSPKWLASITVQDHEADTPIQKKEYRLFAPNVSKETADTSPNTVINDMPVNSAICEPAAGANLKAGPTVLRGYAIATQAGIERVEVSYDGGETWHRADLDGTPDNPWTWVLWSATLDLPAGFRQLRVRAFDKAGATQPETLVKTWNWKGYLANAWHRVDVRVS